MLRDAGITTGLLTDERLVGQHPLAVDFDDLIEIDPPWQPQMADEIEQTHLAKCFAQAIGWLDAAEEPFLLWCHLAGLGTTWDAPLRVPPRVLGGRRSRAARYGRRARPPASARSRSRRSVGRRAGVRRAGHAVGYVPRRAAGVSAASSAGAGDVAGAHLAARLSVGRARPRRPLRRSRSMANWCMCRCSCGFPTGKGQSQRSSALVEPADLWATLLGLAGDRRRRPRPRPPACCRWSAAMPRRSATGCAFRAAAPSGRSARRPGISASPTCPSCSSNPTTAAK